MVAISPTESNRHFANGVNKRIKADSVMLSAKASVWRLGGIGLLIMMACVGAGAGVAAVLFGYSYINDDHALADRMAASFAKALEKIKIPVAGEVEVKPGGTVELQPGGTVELQPGGKVEVTGGVDVKPGGVVTVKSGSVVTGQPNSTKDIRPTPEQLTGTGTNAPANKGNVVTNYTIFKTVEFGTGVVVSGWKYSSNEQNAPEYQYCYYSPGRSGDTSQSIYLVSTGQLTSFGNRNDYKAALAQCVWFNGQLPY